MASDRDLAALETLIKQQKSRFPMILASLEKNGRKTGHWIWWCCPTEMPGAADPFETYVTKKTATALFAEDAAQDIWRQVLEKICDLLEDKGMNVLPRADHGRIHYFLKFWKGLENLPEWMDSVLERMSKYDWPPR
mmetsp:Transcript_27445/g.72869  ORF Transcript_27445/g.72869 Transcript_27445/m.72869 type:complete len:136 (+) Transcript_27445:188-595(+)